MNREDLPIELDPMPGEEGAAALRERVQAAEEALFFLLTNSLGDV